MSMFIKPCDGLMNSLFSNARKHPKLGIVRPHNGVDYTSSPDNTIVAAAAGRVVIARTTEPDGYGKMVAIEHNIDGRTYTTVYAHLASVAVKGLQNVKQGQRIGMKGNTGLSAGTHLHFEIRIGTYSQRKYVDPLPYIFDKETQNIQTMLNKVGYILRADGYYGDETISAVIAFQVKHGLTKDGVCGRGTLAVLEREASKVKPIKVQEKEKEKGVVTVYEKDAKPSPSLAKEVAQAIEMKLTDGTYLQRPATREEVAVMVKRGVEYALKQK